MTSTRHVTAMRAKIEKDCGRQCEWGPEESEAAVYAAHEAVAEEMESIIPVCCYFSRPSQELAASKSEERKAQILMEQSAAMNCMAMVTAQNPVELRAIMECYEAWLCYAEDTAETFRIMRELSQKIANAVRTMAPEWRPWLLR